MTGNFSEVANIANNFKRVNVVFKMLVGHKLKRELFSTIKILYYSWIFAIGSGNLLIVQNFSVNTLKIYLSEFRANEQTIFKTV